MTTHPDRHYAREQVPTGPHIFTVRAATAHSSVTASDQIAV